MTTNVDKNLYNAPATNGTTTDKAPETPKKGLRGAAGGTFIGPITGKDPAVTEGPTSPSHATGDEDSATARGAGGVEDSTSFRKSDTYGVSGANEGGVGGADTAISGPSRAARSAAGTMGPGTRVTPTYYMGRGAVFAQVVTLTGVVDAADSFKLTYRGTDSTTFAAGTNMTAAAIQTSLRTLMADPLLTVSGTTDAGPFIIKHAKLVGSGGLSATEVVDTNSDLAVTISLPKGEHSSTQKGDGGGALGASGRGTTVDGETVTPIGEAARSAATTGIERPLVGSTANPSAGTVAVINGTAKFTMDLNATDVTDYAGAEVLVFRRGSPNTDEDGDFVGAFTLDSATEADALTTANVSGLTAATYAVYVRFIGNDGNVGPLSDRATVVVS